MDSGVTDEPLDYRPATQEDLNALLELEASFYAGEGYPFDNESARAAVARLMREPERGRIWVVAKGDRLVGYFILTFGYSIEFGGVDALLDELYLEPEARGVGLGRRALAVAEAACVELGIRSLHLEVERDKTSAQELYRKCGFNDHRRYLMTKFL
jgi:ribosomal protein S18 acetylase RimI-like enzyme